MHRCVVAYQLIPGFGAVAMSSSALWPPSARSARMWYPLTWGFATQGFYWGVGTPRFPRPLRPHFPWSRGLLSLGGIRRPRPVFCKSPAQMVFCGAGGNRTPVHQAMNVRDTAIPDSLANAARPAGRLTVASGGPRSVFAECQQTFLQSAVFLAVIPRFCCRAAVDRPRAPFLVTMSLRSP